MRNAFRAPFEVKFASGSDAGEFEGYASVFGVQDSHGDVIKPGAFTEGLAERKAAGRTLPMHVMHGFMGGDGVPVGVWKSVAEDDRGLYVQGKISGAATTDAGRLLHERVKDGALPGLSIAWTARPNGVKLGKEAGEPKRILKAVNLHEISLVDDPSNPQTTVAMVKAALADADTEGAATSIAAAMRLHDQSMGDSYSYSSPKDKALLMDHLRDAHEALTGTRAPDGLDGWTKSISRQDYIAGVKATFGLNDAQAAAMADLVLTKSSSGARGTPDVSAPADFSFLASFDLPSFPA